jgi:hypothetical protein
MVVLVRIYLMHLAKNCTVRIEKSQAEASSTLERVFEIIRSQIAQILMHRMLLVLIDPAHYLFHGVAVIALFG